ncbi:MAG: hypothetical protein ACE5H9_12145 [Anaerolineae bacterium]
MKRNKYNSLLGLALIVFGVVLLINNLGLFGNLSAILWGGLFGAAAVAGFVAYFNQRRQWWLLIPSFTMAGTGGAIVAGSLPGLPGELAGGVFLLALSLGFWAIFLLHSENWWAVIPGGVLAVVAFVMAFSAFASDEFVAPLLFVGFGLVFGILWLARSHYGTGWAAYPAAALGGFGAVLALLTGFDGTPGLLPALVLIAIGGGLLWRNLRRPRRNHRAVSPAFGHSKPVKAGEAEAGTPGAAERKEEV